MNDLLVPLETVPHPLTQGWMLLKAKEVYLGSVVVEQSPELLTSSLRTPLPTTLTSNGHLISCTQAQAPCHGLPTRVCAGAGGYSEHLCASTFMCTSGPQSLARRTLRH